MVEIPVAGSLNDVIRDETVGNHPLVLHHLEDLNDLGLCHVVFLSAPDRGRFSKIVRQARDQYLLTVSDAEEFATQGGMITLVSRGKRLRPIINKRAVDGAGLKVSAKLLQVAIVKDG